MSDLERKTKRFPQSFVVALSREEWERNLEQNIELGICTPGETYEGYLTALAEDFEFVCNPDH